MPRLTRFSIAKNDILKFFDSNEKRVYTETDLANVFYENREFWRLAKTMPLHAFSDNLLASTHLKQVEIQFPTFKTVRYVYGDDVTVINSLALSIRKNAYLSHYSAMRLHGLTEQIPKTVYITHEQSPKPISVPGTLTQEAIDKAFSKEQRVSHNVAIYEGITITLLNGKHTNRLGVVEIETDEGEKLAVTDLERTLIDIAVRPNYAGGVGEVLKAYRLAATSVSVNKLTAILSKLNFVYPYHQAIGFYLEQAGGYSDTQLSLMRKKEFTHRFYLTYGMKDMEFSERWQLYYPKGF